MDNPLISIIVPVYNVEQYLDSCIYSLIRQSYKNIEILLIDDGSPDSCGEMCDEWAKKDVRVRVFHQKNSGVSKARNVGLENMRGSLFTAVDPDDYVNENFIMKLFSEMNHFHSDICFCGLYEVDAEHNVIGLKNRTREFYEKIPYGTFEEIIFSPGSNYIIGGVCKLFRSDIVKEHCIRYNEQLKNGEDHVFLHEYLHYASTFSHCGESLYFYLKRENSASSNVSAKKFSKEMLTLWKVINPTQSANSFGWLIYKTCVAMYVYLDCLRFDETKINEFLEVKYFVKKHRWSVLCHSRSDFKGKMKLFLKMYFPRFFVCIH